MTEMAQQMICLHKNLLLIANQVVDQVFTTRGKDSLFHMGEESLFFLTRLPKNFPFQVEKLLRCEHHDR